MRIALLLTLLLTILSLQWLDAQVMLQMDRFGKRKTMDFHEGDIITVKLKGEGNYRELQIRKLYPETNTILSQHGPIQVEDIVRLRTFKRKSLGKYLAYTMLTFSAAWTGYSLIAKLAYKDEPLDRLTLFIILGAALVGGLFRFIFRHKTYRIGKRRGMRIVDITPIRARS